MSKLIRKDYVVLEAIDFNPWMYEAHEYHYFVVPSRYLDCEFVYDEELDDNVLVPVDEKYFDYDREMYQRVRSRKKLKEIFDTVEQFDDSKRWYKGKKKQIIGDYRVVKFLPDGTDNDCIEFFVIEKDISENAYWE